MALPTAVFATIASFGLAGAAVVSSVDSQHGTTRDQYSKNAIAAADAGAGVAMMRLNRYGNSLTTTVPCIGISGSTLTTTTASSDGWCPAIAGTVGSSTYSYRISPLVLNGTTTIVSTGASGTVSRRVAMTLSATSTGSGGILSQEGVIGQDSITLSNSANIGVGVGTNGSVSLTNSATICGDIRYGVGKSFTTSNSAHQCTGYSKSQANETVPDVSSFMPTDIATNNSNYRLVKCTSTNNPVGCQLDTLTTNSHTWPWTPSTRTLALTNSSTMTLGGGDYFLCSLSLSNSSQLYMAAGAKIRIFFDTPEHCGLSSGSTQLDIGNSSSILSTGYGTSTFNVPGFYMLGSTSRTTNVSFGNSGSIQELDLYAPNTAINMTNSSTFKGSIVGKSVTLGNSASIVRDGGYQPPSIGGTNSVLYSRQSYVECVGATASTPSGNC